MAKAMVERPNTSVAVSDDEVSRRLQSEHSLRTWFRTVVETAMVVGLGWVIGKQAPGHDAVVSVIAVAVIGLVVYMLERVYRRQKIKIEVLTERTERANAAREAAERELRDVIARLPRIDVTPVAEYTGLGPHGPQRFGVMWGLEIRNDGGAGLFEATVTLSPDADAKSNLMEGRCYPLFFRRAKTIRAKIISGSQDNVFFGISYGEDPEHRHLPDLGLWYYDERKGETDAILLPKSHLNGEGRQALSALVEVKIVSDPPMEVPWRRQYIIGPGGQLTELTPSGPRNVTLTSRGSVS